MFTYTPLQGALSDSTASQSILELDGGIKVLVDVGWDDSFDVEKLKELEKQVSTLSLILLTHATTEHLAAYAHCCKHFPLFTRIPVYATTPVIALGRTLLQDLYSSSPAAATTIPKNTLDGASDYESQQITTSANILRQPPTYDEISTYFSLIHPLKYSQPHQPLGSPFSPPLNGLTITAYNSGHTLGGTIWHIQHGLESIVHAVDWHQGRENVYAGAAWLGGAGGGGAQVIEQLRKPTALVCSSRGGEKPSVAGGRVKRDELLLEKIKDCVAHGGTVLIPTDSSARMLELAYLLEHAWRADSQSQDGNLRSAKLYLASRSVHSTMRYVRSMLEWMDDSIVREFEAVADTIKKPGGSGQTKGAGPFDFKFMRLLDRKGQIDKILQPPSDDQMSVGRVILASDSSLEWGFSNQVLRQIASNPLNLVILTEEPPLASKSRPSTARMLWSWLSEKRQAGSEEKLDPAGRELEIRLAQKEPLEGPDLANYQQWLAQQRQLQTTLQVGGTAALEAAGDVADDVSDSSSDSEDDDDEQQGKALNAATTLAQASRKKAALTDEDLGINILLKKKGVYDFDVRNKKGRDRMFPHAIRKKRADDYGELIRPEDFLRAEERAEADAAEAEMISKSAEQDGFGKKRKWDDSTAKGKNNGQTGQKRPQLKRRGSDDADGGQAEEAVQDELDEVPEDEDESANSPSKLVVTIDKMQIHMQIDFVDFSGIHDKRSLHMLLPLIQPRKLILTSGGEDETLKLASAVKQLFAEDSIDIYTPTMGTSIDASVDTHAWVVKLAPALVKQLRWQNVRGLSIATVTGRLLSLAKADQKEEDEAAKKRLKTEDAMDESADQPESVAVEPTLDVVPSNMASAARSHAQPLHVGDLRLADLRKAMQQAGHTAEFRGEGTLLVDGSVVVRKTTTGRINVESIGLPTDGGPATQFGGTFYAVKKSIYESLAVVAGA
ncbi:RNA-metabolising metallo-beta-lactamase [Microdochium trichocladiopsis]|uniref:Cleavage and polyadenylation specificity factor subunit 2 n=1 Tax=Microdochium trichocladiopsis TaxID=1682393 RepID=A0A9P8Y6Z5_9PEZI|nr:RNA-metabolising metallo-beta-lactamase [Microdochium trichocladiopsis]KAH7029212.1 RNA-metabolising metallo-beta-lactamase [Microdochium trichocladiopsis]